MEIPEIALGQLSAMVRQPTLDDYRTMVFEVVANSLPTIGRDFGVTVVEAGGNVRVGLSSKTLVGEMFIRYLRGNLPRLIELAASQKNGGMDDQGNREAAEVGPVPVL